MIRQAVNDGAATSDDAPRPNLGKGQGAGAHPKEGTLAQANATREVYPWRNVDKVAYAAVVVDGCPRIDDDVSPQVGAGLDHRPGQDHRAWTQGHRGVHPGARVYQGVPALVRKAQGYSPPGCIVADGDQGGRLFGRAQYIDPANDGNAKE